MEELCGGVITARFSKWHPLRKQIINLIIAIVMNGTNRNNYTIPQDSRDWVWIFANSFGNDYKL